MIATRLRFAAVLVVAVVSALAVAGCSAESGVTATCKQNADPVTGIAQSNDGCDQFALCVDDQGKQQDACTFCCADAEDVNVCMYGFGEDPATCGGGSGGGGGGS